LIGTHVLVVVLDGKRCVSGCGVYLCIYCFRTEGSAEEEPLAIDHRGVFFTLKRECRRRTLRKYRNKRREDREIFRKKVHTAIATKC